MNDGACDPAGRFLAGTMSPDAEPGRGALYRYEPPGAAVPVLTGVGISNGLAWSTAGSTLFFVDTLLQRVDRLAYDVGTGAVTDRRPAFDLSGYGGLPDGMAIDARTASGWRSGAAARSAGSRPTAYCWRRSRSRCCAPPAAAWAGRTCATSM
jgi:sugar lactone lactonase YvrE